MKRGTLLRNIATSGALGLALAASLLATPSPSYAQRVAGPGQLSLTVEALADTASRTDGVDTYRVTMSNKTGGTVDRIAVQVPIAAGYSLAGASFTQDDAWVAATGAGSATLRFEQLRGINDTVVATLRFTGPADAASNALTQRVTATWNKDDKARTVTSNQPGVTTFALAASRAGQAITFSGDAFAAREPVSFWYTSASGASVPLVYKDGQLMVEPARDDDDDERVTYGKFIEAGEQGVTRATLNLAGLPAGSYTFSARGNWSGVTASAPFIIE
jgi:hypothetical protein